VPEVEHKLEAQAGHWGAGREPAMMKSNHSHASVTVYMRLPLGLYLRSVERAGRLAEAETLYGAPERPNASSEREMPRTRTSITGLSVLGFAHRRLACAPFDYLLRPMA
jgi:hypothetical protein